MPREDLPSHDNGICNDCLWSLLGCFSYLIALHVVQYKDGYERTHPLPSLS